MAFPHYLTRTASGRLVFRLRVPADLRALVGRNFIKRSLGHDLRTARLSALDLAGRYALAFDRIRAQGMTKKPTVQEVLANVASNGARRYEISLPGGGILKATDAADHARALEALEAVGRMNPAALAGQPAEPAPKVAEAISLGKARKAWLKAIEPTHGATTYKAKRKAIDDLADYLGHAREVHTISRPDLARFYQHLRDKGNSTPSVYNKQSYLGGAGSFFAWAQASGYFPEGKNPATGHVRYSANEKRGRKRLGFRAFDLDQVRALYAPEVFARLSPGARWAALLGLYSGARATEVGQLLTIDFFEVDDIPVFRISDEGEGQRVKNAASVRTVPIHPDLLALGLLDHVAGLRGSGDWRIFPQAAAKAKNGAGNWISKAFSRHLSTVGADWPEAKRGFHSLRKTVVQQLQAAGVASEMRAQLVGHELDDEHHGTYSREFTAAEKLNGAGASPGLSVLSYGLDLEALRPLLTASMSRRAANRPGDTPAAAAASRKRAPASRGK